MIYRASPLPPPTDPSQRVPRWLQAALAFGGAFPLLVLLGWIVNGAGDASGAVLLVLLWLGIYLLPFWVALCNRSRLVVPVAVVNILGGWTGIGWVTALVMAVWPRPEPVVSQ